MFLKIIVPFTFSFFLFFYYCIIDNVNADIFIYCMRVIAENYHVILDYREVRTN